MVPRARYKSLRERHDQYRCKKTNKRTKTRCRLRMNHTGDCHPRTEG